jgi:hypothetical protein
MAAGSGGNGDRSNPATVHRVGNRNDARQLSESSPKFTGRVEIAGDAAVNFGRIDGRANSRHDAGASRDSGDSYQRIKCSTSGRAEAACADEIFASKSRSSAEPSSKTLEA